MVQKPAASRIHGLDTLRAAAIALVLMSHYTGFVSGRDTFGIVGEVGRAGVDLFFVLSGYLIGNQLLASACDGSLSLRTFFARRFLRTLPNYWATLVLFLLFPAAIGGSDRIDPWRFLSFTQNIGMKYGQSFTHSWSLCIEEQFYVLLPLLVMLFVACRLSARTAWIAAGCAIGAGIAMRGLAYTTFGHGAFSAEVYYSSWGRADGLVPGVAIAMLKHFHPARYDAVRKHGNLLLAAGLAWACAVLYCLQNDAPSPGLATAFGFSLLAIGFAMLTLSALSPNSPLNRIRIPGATRLALWSYAVYLIHKPVFMALQPRLAQWHADPDAPLTVVAVFAAGIAGGWLLFVLVESPCMRLRARWFPAQPRAVPDAGAHPVVHPAIEAEAST